MEIEIKIKINDKEYTMDEARALYIELKKIFDNKTDLDLIPQYPSFSPTSYGPIPRLIGDE